MNEIYSANFLSYLLGQMIETLLARRKQK